MVGLETAKWSESSPADMGRWRRSWRTRRRVGSERALKTVSTSLYLANYLTIVKRFFRRRQNAGPWAQTLAGSDWYGLDHAVEDERDDVAAGCVAGFFGGDAAVEAELGVVDLGLRRAERSEAEIDMFMPAGDAEREALVDLVFGVALGRGVHGADELVAIADFYRGALGRGLRRRGRNETLANGRRVAR